jgi:single-stranded-DNA-specific exonuclease
LKGGGHAMAAGVTLDKARLGDFRAFLEENLAEAVALANADAALEIDAALTAGGATPALVHAVERAGPYGSGNPEPVFAFAGHRLVDVAQVGAEHIRLRAAAGDGQVVEAIAFRAARSALGGFLNDCRGRLVHLAGVLTINRYGGREKAQLRVIDAAPAG